jgi:hypothetical protein
MAEVSNELLYEVLKNLQARMSRFEQTHSEIKTELQAVRGHMLAHQTDMANLYAISARQELRLERVGRRLDLVDEPTS